ncbi:hypothetical protein [Saccharibacillus deserti]|uniref:hypothetical protein n=1 Tax=Saccharibacillus deserti TaxID=1634444 RepID=UPI001554FEF6|nr:hypothetical protein [Saccharibacillus deserti]
MLIYAMLGLMLLSAGFVAYRLKRDGAEYYFVENAGLMIVVLVAVSALAGMAAAGDWLDYARMAYAILTVAYIAYAAYAKYRGGTDGYGQ